MATTGVTRNADGDVTETLDTVPTATVGFGRTVTFPDTFGAKEEASIFIQVPLDLDAAKQIEEAYALAKATVYSQLGLEQTVQANGVITSAPQVGEPKTTKGGGSKPRSAGGASKPRNSNFVEMTDELKQTCWFDLANADVVDKGSYLSITTQSGETVYDNRESKRSPNGPDFKWKDSGYALWLKDAPDYFSAPGQGI